MNTNIFSSREETHRLTVDCDGLVGGEGEVDARGVGLTLVVVDWQFVPGSDQYSADCLTLIPPDLQRQDQ